VLLGKIVIDNYTIGVYNDFTVDPARR
jgi:hypothetical protein